MELLRLARPYAHRAPRTARALAALREDSRGWWQRTAEDGDYEQNAEDLAGFIADRLPMELEGQVAAVGCQREIASFLRGEA